MVSAKLLSVAFLATCKANRASLSDSEGVISGSSLVRGWRQNPAVAFASLKEATSVGVPTEIGSALSDAVNDLNGTIVPSVEKHFNDLQSALDDAFAQLLGKSTAERGMYQKQQNLVFAQRTCFDTERSLAELYGAASVLKDTDCSGTQVGLALFEYTPNPSSRTFKCDQQNKTKKECVDLAKLFDTEADNEKSNVEKAYANWQKESTCTEAVAAEKSARDQWAEQRPTCNALSADVDAFMKKDSTWYDSITELCAARDEVLEHQTSLEESLPDMKDEVTNSRHLECIFRELLDGKLLDDSTSTSCKDSAASLYAGHDITRARLLKTEIDDVEQLTNLCGRKLAIVALGMAYRESPLKGDSSEFSPDGDQRIEPLMGGYRVDESVYTVEEMKTGWYRA
jgi:hypothetical protein